MKSMRDYINIIESHPFWDAAATVAAGHLVDAEFVAADEDGEEWPFVTELPIDPNNTVVINRLDAITPKIGHGSLAMADIVKLADDRGVDLALEPWAGTRTPKNVLIKWYKRFGFTLADNGWMYRRAGGKQGLNEVRRTPSANPSDEESIIARRDTGGDVIGYVNGLEVRRHDYPRVMFITLVGDDGKAVGFVDLLRKSEDHAQINMIRILKKYRGERIMPRVLLMLAKSGLVVEGDDEQTASAIKMWRFLFDEAPRHGCEVAAMKDGQKVALVSPQKTVTGRRVYGRNTPFTLVLTLR